MERLDNKENVQSNFKKENSHTSSKEVKILEPKSPKSSKFKNMPEEVQSDEKAKFESLQK